MDRTLQVPSFVGLTLATALGFFLNGCGTFFTNAHPALEALHEELAGVVASDEDLAGFDLNETASANGSRLAYLATDRLIRTILPMVSEYNCLADLADALRQLAPIVDSSTSTKALSDPILRALFFRWSAGAPLGGLGQAESRGNLELVFRLALNATVMADESTKQEIDAPTRRDAARKAVDLAGTAIRLAFLRASDPCDALAAINRAQGRYDTRVRAPCSAREKLLKTAALSLLRDLVSVAHGTEVPPPPPGGDPDAGTAPAPTAPDCSRDSPGELDSQLMELQTQGKQEQVKKTCIELTQDPTKWKFLTLQILQTCRLHSTVAAYLISGIDGVREEVQSNCSVAAKSRKTSKAVAYSCLAARIHARMPDRKRYAMRASSAAELFGKACGLEAAEVLAGMRTECGEGVPDVTAR